MPIYEYRCEDCSYTFELKQSIKDEAVASCSKCGKSVSRIISAPAIMFKGSGWYITDYSDKMKPPSGEASKPSPTSTTTAQTGSSGTPSTPSAPATTAAPASSSSGSSSTSSPAGTNSSSSGSSPGSS
ncbi:MAG TPA: zinc ribbon domain-containing protein [Nitrospira sp.]|nr:zinc ribbon domain-containing protein [Nitrospira sp.]